MPRSMTGIGVGVVEDARRRVTVEVRSVNHRFFKMSLKAPPAIAALEADLEARLRARHQRGVFNVGVVSRDAAASSATRLDAEAVRARVDEVLRVAAQVGAVLAPHEALNHALRLPGAFAEDARGAALDDETRDAVLLAAERAFDALAESRAAEGAKTAAWLREHAAAVEASREAVARRAPETVRHWRDRFAARVTALLAEVKPGLEPAEDVLLREAAAFADRADVSEELNRLKGHLDLFEKLLADGRDAGRRMDFLLQEMLREVNTLGSKASDLAVAHHVVEMKAEIEKMKEQAANLE